MSNHIIHNCPVCSHHLTIRSLQCQHCNTEINGFFQLSKFNYLTKDQLSFIEVFLKNRGNIKDCEKDLNLSYPTVRRLLDEVITSLGYKTVETQIVNRQEILAQLERGEITVAEATDLLKK